ncbi:hypothetical protein EDM59_22565 [Brevibacillus nitrificans]|uniref:Cell division protein FtsN n=1 Tax=Brevibacillus nitrificans TaxID=651560 RepID=A0A3M8D024_9BACL|nr:TasA family protein [Brevibacillus nitrificans]RNB81420.1 hypothetical protein EDM59_22565 [Brevibacillus nitrificans]
MSLKKQFALTLASVGIGAALIGGGTFAWFNTKTDITGNTFAAGELKLGAKPATGVINVGDIAPGDWVVKSFELKNEGTVGIKQLLTGVNYKVTYDHEGNENFQDEFGRYLKVYYLTNVDKTKPFQLTDYAEVIGNGPFAKYQGKTLEEWKNIGQLDISTLYESKLGGFKPGDTDEITLAIQFVDDGNDQNRFQKDVLDLTLNIEGKARDGVQQ